MYTRTEIYAHKYVYVKQVVILLACHNKLSIYFIFWSSFSLFWERVSFIFLFFIFLLYNFVVVFAIYWHESAMDLHVFPILIPLSASLPIPSPWSSLDDERHSLKFLQFICLLFENDFFDFHHLTLNKHFILSTMPL